MGNLYRPNVDYTLATQAVGDNGKVAFVPKFQSTDAAGAAVGISSTGTVTSVASAAVDTTILAANANRRGAMITNTDTNAVLLLLAAGTASATNYTVSLATTATYTVPFGYTGIIKGIWTVDGVGAALVTEFT